MYRPAVAILLLLVTLANNANAQNNWAAAACAGLGPRCPKYIAKQSGHCFQRQYMSAQPPICRRAACEYCRRLNRRVTQPVCKRESIVKNCFKGRRVSSGGKGRGKSRGKGNSPGKGKGRKKTTKSTKGGGGGSGGTCKVFVGANNKVVIPTNRLPLNSAWTRNGDGSMTWKPDGDGGIDPAGSGTICARFKVPSAGSYYMTIISKAPHPTEHNDAWFKLSAGFRLFRPQGNKWKAGGSGWLKGYQNEGGNKKANYLVTVDFDGHQMISNPLATGREYQACMSGRSSKYTIYQIIFIKCDGSAGCSRFNGPIRNAMKSLPASRC